MSPTTTITCDVHLTDEEWSATLVTDLAAGLEEDPKRLSPVWFYDDRGSALFDEITRLPEYYPTRAERSLLTAHADEIVDLAGADTLVELGSGTSDKTRALLDAMAATNRLERYVPFDVSEQTVRDAAARLVEEYPGMVAHAVIGDFQRHLGAIPRDGRRLVAFLGGTIGNLTPDERARFLFDLDCTMGAEDRLLLGVDLVKDRDVLVTAYDDAAGVTAAFNRNALRHVNDRLEATFDPSLFEHVASWNEADARIEMHLRSTQDQLVHIGALEMDVSIASGEHLLTEISSKFTPDGLERELWDNGFVTEHRWTAPPGYLLVMARPYC